MEKFHLTPDELYSIDHQTIVDLITTANYEAYMAEQQQKEQPSA